MVLLLISLDGYALMFALNSWKKIEKAEVDRRFLEVSRSWSKISIFQVFKLFFFISFDVDVMPSTSLTI